jgi:hypothetical protein
MRATIKRVARLVPTIRRVLDQRDQALAELHTIKRSLQGDHPLQLVLGGEDLQKTILALGSRFTPYRAVGSRKIRVGRENDGGYVLLNDLACSAVALSFGIRSDCSWDLEIANREIDVYMFDHTIDAPPAQNKRFHFFKKKISAHPSDKSENIESILQTNRIVGDRILLKVDIDGSEWEMFDATSADVLRRFSQVTCEFHDFSRIADTHWRERAFRVMDKLKSIFEVVHVHGNNNGSMLLIANVPFPANLEVTLANRALWKFEPTTEVYPTPIDQPNLPGYPDLFLGTLVFNNERGPVRGGNIGGGPDR